MNNKIRFNNARVSGKEVGEYSNMLVDDFFRYVQGDYDNLIVDVRDVNDLRKPTPEYIGKVLARYIRVWEGYCIFNKLPHDSQNLLMAKVKRKWISENWEQKMTMPMRKRTKPVQETS